MELIYYFYYHGDDAFDEMMHDIFKRKDFEAFLKVFETEKDNRLPAEAVLYIGESAYINVPIDNQDVFENLTYFESEWG